MVNFAGIISVLWRSECSSADSTERGAEYLISGWYPSHSAEPVLWLTNILHFHLSSIRQALGVQPVKSAMQATILHVALQLMQAWLGYYKGSLKLMKWTPVELVQRANEFSRVCLGMLCQTSIEPYTSLHSIWGPWRLYRRRNAWKLENWLDILSISYIVNLSQIWDICNCNGKLDQEVLNSRVWAFWLYCECRPENPSAHFEKDRGHDGTERCARPQCCFQHR